MTIVDRESKACEFLDAFPRDVGAVLIGGYAVNPWAPPRYSDDLDIVVPRNAEARIHGLFPSPPWTPERQWANVQNYADGARRFSRPLEDDLALTVDVLVGGVMDRTFKVPIPYAVFQRRSENVVVSCVNARTEKGFSTADPVALCLAKCQPMRPRDKDDILSLLANPEWNRDELHRLCAAYLPPTLLRQQLDELERFAREKRTLRLIRRRFPGLAGTDLERERDRIVRQVREWRDQGAPVGF